MSTTVLKRPAAANDLALRMTQLHQATAELSLFEFWSDGSDPDSAHREATERLKSPLKAIPYLWNYKQIYPLLLEASELVPLSMSERRSLVMMNPALKPNASTVTTLLAAYRINVPGEIAPVHRHTPNAIRLGLTGSTNFTSVDGENITFGPGDLVLTPQDTWHNHGNGPDEASVNLSVLDVPLVNALNATNFDFDYKENEGGKLVSKRIQTAQVRNGYSERMYGSGGLLPRHVSHSRGGGGSSPMFVYRWEQTDSMLRSLMDEDGSAYEGIQLEYVDPVSGGPIYTTMTFFMQMLRRGEKLLAVRQNASQVCTVFRGKGYTLIGEERFDWDKFDTFCIPGGMWYQHFNASASDDALLFVSSDEAALRRLGFYMKEGRDATGDTVLLESDRRKK